MTKTFKKIALIVAFTVISVSVLFLNPQPAQAQSLQWNVNVEILAGKFSFKYNLADNLKNLSDAQIANRGIYLGKKGKKEIVDSLIEGGFSTEQAFCYIFSGFKPILDKIEGKINKKAVDATVEFTPNNVEKFVYKEGKKGVVVDKKLLFRAMLDAVGGKLTKINLPTNDIPHITVKQLKQNTMLRASFSTSYPSSKAERIHNIELATKKINGYILHPDQIFSFNTVVGERSEEMGYKSSKVILNGEYTDDFGGGVCQVSTTLYNTAILACLEIKTVFQHSLVPSYVAPSFDAMVSYPNCDLKFLNNTTSDIYIEAKTVGKTVTFSIYGSAAPYKVVRESVEIERVKFSTKEVVDVEKYPELVYTDQTKIVRGGSDLVKSEGYLNFYKDGKLLNRQKIRKNTYAKVDMLVARGTNPRPVEDIAENMQP